MILQILVTLFLFHLSYDALTLFLWPEFNNLPDKADIAEKTAAGIDLSDPVNLVATPWAVAVACLMGLIAARIFLRRRQTVPQDVIKDIAAMVAAEDRLDRKNDRKLYKSDSFITCKPSRMSLNSENECKYATYDDVHLLLDEVRSSMETKMDEMERLIKNVHSDSTTWTKRMDQMEKELSFIHHQIFIMLNNMKLSVVRTTEFAVPKQQLETIKDLNKILEEVKQEFKADEALKIESKREIVREPPQNSPVVQLIDSNESAKSPIPTPEEQAFHATEDVLENELLPEQMISEVEETDDTLKEPQLESLPLRPMSLWVRSPSLISTEMETKVPPAEATRFGPTVDQPKSKSVELAQTESSNILMFKSEAHIQSTTPVKPNTPPPEDKLLQIHESNKYQEILKDELESLESSRVQRSGLVKEAEKVAIRETTIDCLGSISPGVVRPAAVGQAKKPSSRTSTPRQKNMKPNARYTVIK